jgi:hypothetical protein
MEIYFIFFWVYSIYYEFFEVYTNFRNIKTKNDLWKRLNEWTVYGPNLARVFAPAARPTAGFGPNGLGHGVLLGMCPGQLPRMASARWRGCHRWLGRQGDHRVESSPRMSRMRPTRRAWSHGWVLTEVMRQCGGANGSGAAVLSRRQQISDGRRWPRMSPRALGEGGESDVWSNQRQGEPGGRAHRGSSNGRGGDS